MRAIGHESRLLLLARAACPVGEEGYAGEQSVLLWLQWPPCQSTLVTVTVVPCDSAVGIKVICSTTSRYLLYATPGAGTLGKKRQSDGRAFIYL